MSTEDALGVLTRQVNLVLDTVLQQRAAVDGRISNAIQIPLIGMATTFVQGQTTLINYIGARP